MCFELYGALGAAGSTTFPSWTTSSPCFPTVPSPFGSAVATSEAVTWDSVAWHCGHMVTKRNTHAEI